ncbi:MAG: trypsin-like peptidase domain-containing protein [Clostridia bacterium]|nr:trypsin-like peptidase domain-containing protein [Clostridia bacterium]
MNDFYGDQVRSNKPGFLSYFVIALISAVVGGLVVLGLGPKLLDWPQGQENKQVVQDRGSKEAPVLNIDPEKVSPTVAIAEKVGPAVVGIRNLARGVTFFGDVQEVENGTGSGVIIDKAGYIVTNNHVIEGATQIIVSLSDGRQVKAKLIGRDGKTDLAVLKINAPNLTVAKLGDSTKLKVGELAVAIGNPMGLEFAGSVTTGVISALNRAVPVGDQKFKLIQTDAAINPGNSGGALINARGEVIGINSAKLAGGAEGMGFSIPISSAKPIIKELIEKGYVSRPWIGIEGGVVTPEIKEELKEEYDLPQGIYISKVIAYSPAHKADIQPGDIITTIDGKEIKSMDELQNFLNKRRPGDKVKISLFRENKALEVVLTLGEMPRD